MIAQTVFLFSWGLLFIFNVGYIMQNPTTLFYMGLGFITTTVCSAVAVVLLASLNVAGSGMNTAGTRISFGMVALMGLLFQINLAGLPLGVGLCNNLFAVFLANDMLGIPFYIATGITTSAFISGIIIIVGGTH